MIYRKALKIIFSHILLLTLILRPLYTIGYVAYYELNIDYIIETYCENKAKPQLKCNGKCHLADQLALTANTDSSNSDGFNTFYEAFLPVYFQEFQGFSMAIHDSRLPLDNWSYRKTTFSCYITILSPPPKVA